jgi:hypothetical protein
MHDTLYSLARGNIDVYSDDKIEGWLFYIYKDIYKEEIDSRVIEEIEEDVFNIYDCIINIERLDVSKFYKNDLYSHCGFIFNNSNITKKNFKIQILINNIWETVFDFKKKNIFLPIMNRPNISFLVIDNFYKEPDKIREFALNQTFNEHKEYHKGRRTEERFNFKGIKEEF